MVGIIVGSVCLFGLVKVVGRRHGHGSACRGRHGRRSRGRRDHLEEVLSELDVTQEQDDKIRDAVRGFYKRARKLRSERERSRQDIAEVMRSEDFDENIMGEMFVRHDDVMRELRKDTVEVLAQVHFALEPRQRIKLASIIDTGPTFFGMNPYRWARSH